MEYIYVLNVIMFARNLFLFRDKQLNKRKTFYLSFLQTIPLFIFNFNLQLLLLILSIIIFNYIQLSFEKRTQKLNQLRFFLLLAQVLLFSIFSSGAIPLVLNGGIIPLFTRLSHYSILFNILNLENLRHINIISLGLLFLFNEVNLLIRYILELFELKPGNGLVCVTGYNAGRVIGILERVIIFILVIVNQYAAIGLIMAAKGFTRFKELDRREFAEYVLIGTLLSSLFAVLTSLGTISLLAVFK